MHEAGEVLSIGELVELGGWVENLLSASTALPLYYSHPPVFKPLGKQFGDKGNGCGVCGIFGMLGVLSDGSYALCGIGETVPELVFGHGAQDPLAKVWMETAVLNEIRDGLPGKLEGICSYCLMKKFCLGHCIAQNYYSNKNLWSPNYYCQEARRIGLFPETRICPIPLAGTSP